MHLGNKAKILHKSWLHVHTSISFPLGKATPSLPSTVWFQPIISMTASPHQRNIREHQRKKPQLAGKGFISVNFFFRIRKVYLWEMRGKRICQYAKWKSRTVPTYQLEEREHSMTQWNKQGLLCIQSQNQSCMDHSPSVRPSSRFLNILKITSSSVKQR